MNNSKKNKLNSDNIPYGNLKNHYAQLIYEMDIWEEENNDEENRKNSTNHSI